MSLKSKTITGIFWAFSQKFGIQGINFGVTVVLARLLIPEDFGIIGMILVFVAIGDALVEGGLASSLIRNKDNNQDDYSTVFWMNILMSLLIYIILFFVAPLIAIFFEKEILTDIIRVFCLLFVIRSFSLIQKTRLIIDMNFKRILYISIPSVLFSGIVGIVFAYNGFGVWSLVYMHISQALFMSIQFWIFNTWRPGFRLDLDKLKYHFNFGYKLTLSSLLDTVFKNSYLILIGKYFSAAQLGLYTQAVKLKDLPVKNLSQALNTVTYPMFSAIQDDDAQLKNAYKKLMEQAIFWMAPLLIWGIVMAEPLILFVFGNQWIEAVPFFQIIAIAGMLYPIHSYNLNILKVKGRSDLFLKLEVYKKGLTVIALFMGVIYGIYALLWTQVVNSFLSLFINSHYSGRMINFPLLEQIKSLIPGISIALMSASLVWISIHYLNISFTHLTQLMIGTLIGVSSYLLLAYVFKLNALKEFRSLIKTA
ncbi:MAG: lipopolysaccharide biosynthesis protein [Cyclobacteriaceae bacterium]|nr:lipopolysaccharide biosynthesis protein [Cyclobacteriaceae bacterium]MCH8515281.1 lipopolysaccharide biosynthesis protein [Cyclobacteriaceae bacterium]